MINGKTKIYGIIGKPVSHTLSPLIHNQAYKELELNNVYLPFEVDNVEEALVGLKALGVLGVSVTIPHKQSVIPFLDSIDPVAQQIGAVNTLEIKDNKIHGLNTDWLGANKALEDVIDLPGKTVLILGAGGSARAIGFGLLEAGARVIIASRTPDKGKKLAEILNCPWQPLSMVEEISADALVNATSVGMSPNSSASPVAPAVLEKFPVVMDIVYSPLQTKLLSDAKKAGCTIINGLAMLLYQGVAQFEIWTNKKAPIQIMKDILTSRFS
jgi:shikimate dehydrogenase